MNQRANPILEHALHNEKLSNELFSGGEFYDWVVTTCYYSAIYFVINELFPNQYDIGGKPFQCHSFDDYCFKKSRSNVSSNRNSKHDIREELVKEYLPDIRVAFHTLRDWKS